MTAVYAVHPLRDLRWATFVETHPAASVFHTPGWITALERTYAYEPIVYTTAPPDSSLTNGILLCRVASRLTGRRLVSLPFADHCNALVDLSDERSAIAGALRHAASDCDYVELRTRIADEWQDLGFSPALSFSFHVLDLRSTLDDIFAGFHESSIQRRIRRAARAGVVCAEGTSEAHLRAFYRLMIKTRRRHGMLPQPRDWFSNLVDCLGNRVNIRVAMKGSRAIASILTLRHRNTLVYKYGCSDERFHNLGAMPLLFWAAIQDAKMAGIEKFDLGRSDFDNPGLSRFKERLGATASRLTYVRWSVRVRHGPRWRPSLPKRLIASLPDSLLAAAGRVLYRHFG